MKNLTYILIFLTISCAVSAQPIVKTLELRKGKVAYIDEGAGDTIILIHGLGADMTRWSENIYPLARDHRVVAMDLYGFGQSARIDEPYNARVFVDQIAESMDRLGIDKATLVGNSMGGWISLLFAEAYPERSDKLVLVAPAFMFGIPENVSAKQLERGAQPQTTEEMAAYLSRVYADPQLDESILSNSLEKHTQNNWGDAIRSMSVSIKQGEYTLSAEQLETISSPTLIVHGDADGIVPVASSGRIQLLIDGAELAVAPNTGHWPQKEAAEWFNNTVTSFLSSK